MFEHWSYVAYTLLFCLPPMILIWLRREFFEILWPRLPRILLATLILTVYGCLIWPVALKYGAWAYNPDKISNIKILDYVYIDDVIWWSCIGFLFSSFIVISRRHEAGGVDLFLREIRRLTVSFIAALQGLKTITRERNSTIHLAVAVFVVLEGLFFKISAIEWMFVVVAIGAVLGFELMNSAIEHLATKSSSRSDEQIRIIKDTAAAGVLMASLAAAVIGLLIFFSRLWERIF